LVVGRRPHWFSPENKVLDLVQPGETRETQWRKSAAGSRRFAARGLDGESAAGDTASEASDAVAKANDSAICVAQTNRTTTGLKIPGSVRN